MKFYLAESKTLKQVNSFLNKLNLSEFTLDNDIKEEFENDANGVSINVLPIIGKLYDVRIVKYTQSELVN